MRRFVAKGDPAVIRGDWQATQAHTEHLINSRYNVGKTRRTRRRSTLFDRREREREGVGGGANNIGLVNLSW